MKRCKRLVLTSLVFVGCVFSAENHSAFAQWQPVIRQDGCPTYQPVCARARKSVLVTYANACAAKSALARVVADGVCPDNCPHIYKPVCARGADGQRKNYLNSCAAKNEQAQLVRNGRCLLPSRS
jgi:hypothetical protein